MSDPGNNLKRLANTNKHEIIAGIVYKAARDDANFFAEMIWPTYSNTVTLVTPFGDSQVVIALRVKRRIEVDQVHRGARNGVDNHTFS